MRILVFCTLLIATTLCSCKKKNNCEINHTGNLIITNSTEQKIDININGKKAFELNPNENNQTTYPVGIYDITATDNSTKIMPYPAVAIIQCEDTKISVNFDE